jgi:ankyrin repeat protein
MEDDKKLEKSVLIVFDKGHNPTNESSEAEALELLSKLPNPAEVRDEDEDQLTLLHHACLNGWFEVSKVLIEKYNCDPYNSRSAVGSIPLRLACWSGNLDLVKYLILDKGCDPNDRNHRGLVPLHNAVLGEHLDITEFLIEHCKVDSAPKDSMAYTPLHLA